MSTIKRVNVAKRLSDMAVYNGVAYLAGQVPDDATLDITGQTEQVLATIDKFAYEKSLLINVGDEKGLLLDAAVRRANPALALELGTYCGYGALRIAGAAPNAKVFSVELAEATSSRNRSNR